MVRGAGDLPMPGPGSGEAIGLVSCRLTSSADPPLLVDLSEPLRQQNKRLPTPVERVLPPFVENGMILGMPEFLWTARIVPNRQALGSSWKPPSSDGTLAEFIEEVDRFASSHPLAAALGGLFNVSKGGQPDLDPTLWVPFGVGFGGRVVQDARYDLTPPNTMAGLRTLTTLVHSQVLWFDGAFQLVDDPQNCCGLSDREALPYPRMPVSGVLPYTAWGWSVAQPTNQGVVVGHVSQEGVLAAFEFLTWLYEAPQQQLFSRSGLWPVNGAGWAKQPVGAYSLSDLFSADALIPPGPRGGGLAYVNKALGAAFANPADLPGLLATAQERANVALSGTSVPPV